MDCVRLSSIGSEIELTQIRPFDFVRLPNSIELNPRIEVRLSSISERSICYAGFPGKPRSRIEDRGSSIEDRGSGIGDRESGIGDRGSGIEENFFY